MATIHPDPVPCHTADPDESKEGNTNDAARGTAEVGKAPSLLASKKPGTIAGAGAFGSKQVEGAFRYRCLNKNGMAYRKSKDRSDRYVGKRGPEYDEVIEAVDDGHGWLTVSNVDKTSVCGQFYLPTYIAGVLCFERQLLLESKNLFGGEVRDQATAVRGRVQARGRGGGRGRGRGRGRGHGRKTDSTRTGAKDGASVFDSGVTVDTKDESPTTSAANKSTPRQFYVAFAIRAVCVASSVVEPYTFAYLVSVLEELAKGWRQTVMPSLQSRNAVESSGPDQALFKLCATTLFKPDMAKVRELIARGIDFQFKNMGGVGRSCLVQATLNAHTEVVRALLEADPSTAAIRATKSRNVEAGTVAFPYDNSSFRGMYDVAISPDGTFALTADYTRDKVGHIDLVTDAVTFPYTAGSNAIGITISPDGMFDTHVLIQIPRHALSSRVIKTTPMSAFAASTRGTSGYV